MPFYTTLYGMGLLLGSGLQAANTGLWPWTRAKLPFRRRSQECCKKSFPSQARGPKCVPLLRLGGGVPRKLASVTLGSRLEFDTFLDCCKMLHGRPTGAPKLSFGNPGHPNGDKMGGKMEVQMCRNAFLMKSGRHCSRPIICYVSTTYASSEIRRFRP